jgi:hypothetical protein
MVASSSFEEERSAKKNKRTRVPPVRLSCRALLSCRARLSCRALVCRAARPSDSSSCWHQPASLASQPAS